MVDDIKLEYIFYLENIIISTSNCVSRDELYKDFLIRMGLEKGYFEE